MPLGLSPGYLPAISSLKGPGHSPGAQPCVGSAQPRWDPGIDACGPSRRGREVLLRLRLDCVACFVRSSWIPRHGSRGQPSELRCVRLRCGHSMQEGGPGPWHPTRIGDPTSPTPLPRRSQRSLDMREVVLVCTQSPSYLPLWAQARGRATDAELHRSGKLDGADPRRADPSIHPGGSAGMLRVPSV